jgi:hypothetical protein
LCCFLSQVNKERNGIEIAFEPGKKLDAVENLISGAVILFSDIYGVDMDPTTSAPVEVGTIPEVVNALFSFSLVTREDVLQFRFMEEGGGPWLSAIKETIDFMSIPTPTSRIVNNPNSSSAGTSLAMSPGTRGSNGSGGFVGGGNDAVRSMSMSTPSASVHNATQIEFATVSGQVFSASGDVQVFLQALINGTHKFNTIQAVNEVASKFSEIFRYLSEVKCNKEVSCQFGERMEDCVRILADPSIGILNVAAPSHTNTISSQLHSLSLKLNDCIDYLLGVSNVGWLPICLKPTGAANTKYKLLDLEITSIMNALIRATGNDISLVFMDIVYEAGADVRKSMLALGGAESIYKDSSKIRALAKLIQTTQSDLEEELRLMVTGSGSDTSSSTHTILHSISTMSVLSNSEFNSNNRQYNSLSNLRSADGPPSSRNSRASRGSRGQSVVAGNPGGSNGGGNGSCFSRYLCCCLGGGTKSGTHNLKNRVI